MFTGIVATRGRVTGVDRGEEKLAMTIAVEFDGLEPGESIAVSGACFTVVDVGEGWFRVDAVVTTRGRTCFGETQVGDEVNLERSMPVHGRFGGHLVQGHVDGVGTVVAVEREADAVLADVQIPEDVAVTTILHGSIALDGVSLTVNAIPAPNTVQVSVVPYTLEHTTLGAWQVGDRVHVEGDVIGKYVRQLLQPLGKGAVEVSE